MTALLVLKPGVTDTVNRAVARVSGTLTGAILVSFCIAHLNPSPLVLAAFTLPFAWLSYGTLNVNYALFSVFITGYIVFLLSLAVAVEYIVFLLSLAVAVEYLNTVVESIHHEHLAALDSNTERAVELPISRAERTELAQERAIPVEYLDTVADGRRYCIVV